MTSNLATDIINSVKSILCWAFSVVPGIFNICDLVKPVKMKLGTYIIRGYNAEPYPKIRNVYLPK